jgi:hypothetical protein
MKRRDFLRLGLTGLAGQASLAAVSGSAASASRIGNGGVGRLAVIGESVLGTPRRLSANQKVFGLSVLVETVAPNGRKPYLVELFLEKETASDWKLVYPRKNSHGEPDPIAKAYTNVVGPLGDDAVVRSDRAAVAFFLPYAAMPFEGEDRPLGQMRFMICFSPETPGGGGYVYDSAFDRAFANARYFLRGGQVRSERTVSRIDRSFFVWNIHDDTEEGISSNG